MCEACYVDGFPIGARVVSRRSGATGKVIILNPNDHLEGLVGVKADKNGHEHKVWYGDLAVVE